MDLPISHISMLIAFIGVKNYMQYVSITDETIQLFNECYVDNQKCFVFPKMGIVCGTICWNQMVTRLGVSLRYLKIFSVLLQKDRS